MYAGVMECGVAEASGLGFVCFAVIKPRVFLANRVDFRLLFCFINCPSFTPPPHSSQSYPGRGT